MQSGFDLTLFLIKLFGGVAGSVISLSVLIPSNRQEIYARMATGVFSSLLLTKPLSDVAGWSGKGVEYIFAASGLTAFCAWFLFGLAARTADQWKTLDDALRTMRSVKKEKE